MILLAGVVLVLGSLLWHRARTRTGKTRVEGRTSRHAAMHNARLKTQATEDIQELMVRLEELSREMCGQIDTRFAKLEHVIAEAEGKLAALRGALRQAAECDPAAPPRADEPPSPERVRRARVCQLALAGRLHVEIAREMDMDVGEVELILALERSRLAIGESSAATPPEAAPRPGAATGEAAPPEAPPAATAAPAKPSPAEKKPKAAGRAKSSTGDRRAPAKKRKTTKPRG